MAQEWKEQLQSEDPQIRAAAVKQIALSGNQQFLPLLREIVENDPDPRLREYAKKAARHLFTMTREDQPEEPPAPAPPPKEQPIVEEAEAEAPADTPQSKVSAKNRETANAKVQRALTLHMYGQTQKAIKALIQALEINPYLKEDSYTKNVAAELTGQPSNLAINALKDPAISAAKPSAAKVEGSATASQTDIDESSAPPLNLVQSWLSFLGMDERFFRSQSRAANREDTLVSVLVYTIAAVVIFMINGFFQFQQIMSIMNEQIAPSGTDLPAFDFNFGVLFFAILIGTVILTPLSFYVTVGMQYLGGRIFGGTGTFQTHAYLMALVQVPMTILSGVVTLLALIPIINFLAGLAGFALSIYGIILTVRLVKAAHGLGTGQAVGAIFIPPIILSIVGGCLFMIVGSSLIGSLMQLQ
jgi:hypothetical protein